MVKSTIYRAGRFFFQEVFDLQYLAKNVGNLISLPTYQLNSGNSFNHPANIYYFLGLVKDISQYPGSYRVDYPKQPNGVEGSYILHPGRTPIFILPNAPVPPP